MGILKEKGGASYSCLFNKCKHAAKQRSLVFNLSREEHKSLIVPKCHYCGGAPNPFNSYLKNKGKEQVRINRYSLSTIDRNWIVANGIDRRDNFIGYTLPNCLPCCAICNYIKCDMSYDDFVNWIKAAHKHLYSTGG